MPIICNQGNWACAREQCCQAYFFFLALISKIQENMLHFCTSLILESAFCYGFTSEVMSNEKEKTHTHLFSVRQTNGHETDLCVSFLQTQRHTFVKDSITNTLCLLTTARAGKANGILVRYPSSAVFFFLYRTNQSIPTNETNKRIVFKQS